jgi:hypothetical protein
VVLSFEFNPQLKPTRNGRKESLRVKLTSDHTMLKMDKDLFVGIAVTSDKLMVVSVSVVVFRCAHDIEKRCSAAILFVLLVIVGPD